MFLNSANKFLINNGNAINKITKKIEDINEFKETYKLVQELSSVNGFDVSEKLFHRTMFSSETLPPMGKEYWWFLFIGNDGEKPIQLMFLIFRKHGKTMMFNDKKMMLKKINKDKFQAVTTCWVWDGKKLCELGDANAVTKVNLKEKSLTSQISEHKVSFKGEFPKFKLKIGEIIDLNMTELKKINNKDAYGVFLPPFGMGWADAFSVANGTVFGKEFNGIAHLQKVVGVTTSGCFNWANVFFESGSSASFFCVRPKKNSKTFLHTSFNFYDHKSNKVIKFEKPKLKILKKITNGKSEWIIEGHDKYRYFKIVLETYAKKKYRMENGGWQVYIEYAVIAKEFSLKTKNRKIDITDLGRGVGSFEDAYGFVV